MLRSLPSRLLPRSFPSFPAPRSLPSFPPPLPSLSTSSTRPLSSSPPPLTYFSSWFCPFAHRCTLALEHHEVPYEWVEALGWETRAPSGDPSEDIPGSSRAEFHYHHKSPALLACNPLGMIPTLLCPATSRVATESLLCVELADELALSRGSGAPPLLPGDPWDRAAARAASERVNKSVCSRYYGCLVLPDRASQLAAFSSLSAGLASFTKSLEGGAFYGGSGSLTSVDCALLPYAFRLYVLEHYRGPEFRVGACGGEWAPEYEAWLQRALALPSVARTLPDKERYLAHVEKYASGRARSKVGNAVRRGRSAHEYDDDIDGEDK